MIEGIFVEGLIFSVMVLGILITFRLLDFPDLTCDGSVATGAAVAAMCITGGLGVFLSLLLSFISGVAAGLITAVIHNKLRIPGLLAGILTMTMLFSINLRILGNRANVPLLRVTTFYTEMKSLSNFFTSIPSSVFSLIGSVLMVIMVKAVLDWFLNTDLGTSIGALGSNEQMVISQGINPEILKYIGVGLSNGLIALSGALLAEYQGFADANLGQGMVVQGLAGILLGEFLFRSNRIELITLRAVFGAIVYKALLFFGRKYGYLVGITPNDFKLLTGILVILSLAIAKTGTSASDRKAKRTAIKAMGGRND